MICIRLEKTQTELSRLQEVGYNRIVRGVHCISEITSQEKD
jgi:hypothetical protein